MPPDVVAPVSDVLRLGEGYVYPNELHLIWSLLIVVYPYVTGLVAGAFILASLVRVFNVKALAPTYRLALLTSLAFLIAAPLPLLFHLGHPERSFEIMITPHLSSPMAMFGFVYAWYMMAVLLLELWFDYRKDFVEWSRTATGFRRLVYRTLTLGIRDVSENALRLDGRMGRIVTIVGIPSAFLLHGYVGFIFGSVKGNPWWGTVLMPIIFIFSAIVSGIALCLVLYMILSWLRHSAPDDACLDAMGSCLFYALIVAASVESLDWVHRLYEREESIHMMKALATGRLFDSLILVQGVFGMLIPFLILAATQVTRLGAPVRRTLYFAGGILILIGVLAMRWNVVIGGQLLSKSLRGLGTYSVPLAGHEGLLSAFALTALPLLILWGLVRLFLPENRQLTS